MDRAAMKTVLFLCTGNSARSILGEVIFNEVFGAYGRGYSAGSKPVGRVNPAAIVELRRRGHSVEGLSSQHVEAFCGAGAPAIDVVISVCDNAAEDCPIWPGAGTPKRLHWPFPDPADVVGEAEKAAAFAAVYEGMLEKLAALVATL